LLQWRKEVAAKISATLQNEQDAAEASPDWIDVASRHTQSETTRVNREHSIGIIREIDAALQRIRLGTYGFCIDTGEEIGLKRLNAMPIARYSIFAQEEREQRRKSYF
jgi:DnaK suppressor protein